MKLLQAVVMCSLLLVVHMDATVIPCNERKNEAITCLNVDGQSWAIMSVFSVPEIPIKVYLERTPGTEKTYEIMYLELDYETFIADSHN